MNKNFRSSKNLKQLALHTVVQPKDDSAILKLKIKNLQEQVELLKKTNLNIYIPLSQKEQGFKEKQNKDQTIRKLKVLLLKEQQENQSLKSSIKKLEKQKQLLKINYQNQIKKISQELMKTKQTITQLQQQNEQLEEKYVEQKKKKEQIQKDFIQIKVQLKFLKEDLELYKAKFQSTNKNFNDLKSLVLQVEFNSKIYKAHQIKITAIQSSELASLRNCIFELQREIQQLLYKLSNPKKEQKIHFNMQTKNVAEQIVKLKKNIDMQLGFKGDQSVIKSFLDKYSQTSEKFKQLIDGCKASPKISQLLHKK